MTAPPATHRLALALLALCGLGIAVSEVAFVERLGAMDANALLRGGAGALGVAALLGARALIAAISAGLEQRLVAQRLATLRLAALRTLMRASPYSALPTSRESLPDALLLDTARSAALAPMWVLFWSREPVRALGFLSVLSRASLPMLLGLGSFALLAMATSRLLDRLIAQRADAQNAAHLGADLALRGALREHEQRLVAGTTACVIDGVASRLEAARGADAAAARVHATAQLVARITYYGIVLGGAWLASRGDPVAGSNIHAAGWASLGLAAAWLQGPIAALGAARRAQLESESGQERLRALSQLPPLGPAPRQGHAIEALRAEIVLRDVSFSYQENRPILTHVSLRIPVGSCVGVTGRSGAGKSTLLRLLARIVEPTHGELRFDDIALREIEDEDLRRLLAASLQPARLLEGTVRDNVSSGTPMDDAAVTAALARVGLEPGTNGFPSSLETSVGELGARLSEGQIVRLAVARVLARPASVLIFDEPTASLDTLSAERVLAALAEARPERTVVIASHDPRVLALCNLFIHVDAGAAR